MDSTLKKRIDADGADKRRMATVLTASLICMGQPSQVGFDVVGV